MDVGGADRPSMEFGDDFRARTLNDRDPGKQRGAQRQGQDRSVPGRNWRSRRLCLSVESGNDEIKDLWRLNRKRSSGRTALGG